MPDGNDSITVDVLASIHELEPAHWDACARQDQPDANPFVSHGFLAALEDSGSVGGDTGWIPRHLAVRLDGRLTACAPAYVKTHSYGEYVFDWAWADAFHRAGGDYYPKLLCAVPFTPVTGPRLLVHPDADRATMTRALASAMVQLADQSEFSSVHVNFLPRESWETLGQMGMLRRVGMQYLWHNNGYESFDDFLGDLNSRKRKAVRKERREVADSGIQIRTVYGPEITDRMWDRYFRFYINTSNRKWGDPYLKRSFFSRMGAALGDRVALVLAYDGEDCVAGALNMLGGDGIYGRYWGCTERYKHLHFELCYYQAIEIAIARKLARVEAGAQGEHKIQRGYLPRPTYSAHWIINPDFSQAVEKYLDHERQAVMSEIEDLIRERSPFRQGE